MKKSQNKLFNVASARLSKSKEYVNFCLISGKDDKKEFATICKKKEDCKFSKGKDGKYYVYFVVELKENKSKEETKTADEIKVKRNEIVDSDTTDIGLDIDDYL